MSLTHLVARDGTTCVWCGRTAWAEDLTAEHLLPRARGGRGYDENLAVACRRCNRQRGTRAVVAYVRERSSGGQDPSVALLRRALERLAGSASRDHAEYAVRQLVLLGRLTSDDGAAPDGQPLTS